MHVPPWTVIAGCVYRRRSGAGLARAESAVAAERAGLAANGAGHAADDAVGPCLAALVTGLECTCTR